MERSRAALHTQAALHSATRLLSAVLGGGHAYRGGAVCAGRGMDLVGDAHGGHAGEPDKDAGLGPGSLQRLDLARALTGGDHVGDDKGAAAVRALEIGKEHLHALGGEVFRRHRGQGAVVTAWT